ncbi:MAG: Fe-S cluster assembly protein SufD [Ignavibacteriae bacterium]|nr:MAG: Fe-S cluster assembly protein SufD [Ignavibacteriota bacterium]
MSSENSIKKWYSENFKEFHKLNNDGAFDDLRKNAFEGFNDSKFPTKKDEEWKYTNVYNIFNEQFIPSPLKQRENNIENISEYLIPGLDVHLIVLVDGIFNDELSKIGNLQNGVIIDSFYNQSKVNKEFLLQYISKKETVENSFDYLNKTFTYDGFVIYLPKNQIAEKPIHILNISTDGKEKNLIQPRNLIVAEENSQAKIITEYISTSELEYFTNIITEIYIDENANVSFYKLQSESKKAYHIDKTEIIQKEQSVFNHFSLSFGSRIARNDINTKLDGENIELHLYGLYLGNEEQHIDHHTFIDHAHPNCESNELYKGILDDKATGVFSGKIYVNKIAQKTNAFQSNKSILLSDEATINAKPQLEIYADDVKCSHGATVGKLDEKAYYYIRSRGVPAESARSMLIRAFVDDVISQCNIQSLREKINHTIFENLHREEF